MKKITKDNIKSELKLDIRIITLSDRAHSGEYEDRSGPVIKNLIFNYFNSKEWKFDISLKVIPDNSDRLKKLISDAKNEKATIIITTGGTGIGPNDITVETVRPFIDKEIPGIMELIRVKYGQQKPNALLSRGIAGLMDETLVYTLPGSVKAVNEYMTEILNTLEHLIYMKLGIDVHACKPEK
ncbi:molybdenum cofactor synthesis domain-containing protein [Bacteroidota bacterium]